MNTLENSYNLGVGETVLIMTQNQEAIKKKKFQPGRKIPETKSEDN